MKYFHCNSSNHYLHFIWKREAATTDPVVRGKIIFPSEKVGVPTDNQSYSIFMPATVHKECL